MGEDFEAICRAEKTSELLDVFEQHIAGIVKRPLTLADTSLLLSHAERTLAGERVTIRVRGNAKETYKFWNDLAEGAEIPKERWPSTRTVRMLVERLRVRLACREDAA